MKRIMNYAKEVMAVLVFISVTPLFAQTEVMAWGNMTGVRVDGQLMEFESSLRVIEQGWSDMQVTGKEKQVRPLYHRNGNTQSVETFVNKVKFNQTVTDKEKGLALVNITAKADTTISTAEGAYFCIDLPENRYANGTIIIGGTKIKIDRLKEYINSKKSKGKEIIILGMNRSLKLSFSLSVTAFIRKEIGSAATIYIQLLPNIKKGEKVSTYLKLHADGIIDHSDANINLNVKNPGRIFIGFGGNFRLQDPLHDPEVISYCLENMRVAYGRVEFPWRMWQPDENSNPIAEANSGKLNKRVEAAILMAKRLKAEGMPLIVSCWFPPAWAIDGDPKNYVRHGGVQAFKLNPNKLDKIYKSIADYLVFIKQNYGVEVQMFSFNESDLGIDILHTPQEHAAFIKGLGAYFAKRGLPTRMLLGDNSDATTFDFILPALNDPDTHKYIGAISFHSWRGCDDKTLSKWAAASRELNVPLIVGEGSTDAAAHSYPEIFNESTFALYEINLYTRICAICQPMSILQWQLTSDYSLLWGNGIYGSTGKLHPTQRFWNIKQLASTPANALAIPVTCSKEEVNCTAFGNIVQGKYAIHMVNNGANCNAIIHGIPAEVKELQVYVTNSNDSMKKYGKVKVENGQMIVCLPAISFITLLTE